MSQDSLPEGAAVRANETPAPPALNSSTLAGGTEAGPAANSNVILKSLGMRGPLAATDLALFAEMLAGLVRANMPLPEALKLIGREAENRRLREALARAEKEVAGGMSLPEALRQCAPAEFPELFIRLLEQGMTSNDFHAALLELVREFRAEARFREQLWAQVIGPVITSAFIGFGIFGLFLIEVPHRYAEIFRWLRVDLPLPTWLMIEASRILHDGRFYVALVFVLMAAAFVVSRIRLSRRLTYSYQKTALRLPVLGPYLRTLMLARICRMLGMLLRQKIPLHQALCLVRDTVSIVPMQEAVNEVADEVGKGKDFSEALAACGMFPPTLSRFVRGGLAHGELPQSLLRMAELYDERGETQGTQVRFAVFVMTQLAVGFVLFVAIIAFLFPIFKIQEVLR
ncbi:MAG TPA: type II secretion system F family protein [Planctomycetota bacterium]|nr:type II secretion system F family protein [Planctomycetota bacterium]